MFKLIVKKCEQLRNFNLLVEVIAGLNLSPVYRLKKTWKLVSEDLLKEYKRLQAVVSPKGNYKNLRKLIKERVTPCIPYIGMYLTDLTFIEDGNKDEISNGSSTLINFAKRRLLGEIIEEIQFFQESRYQIYDIPELRKRFVTMNTMDTDKLYEMSLILEPRASKTRIM